MVSSVISSNKIQIEVGEIRMNGVVSALRIGDVQIELILPFNVESSRSRLFYKIQAMLIEILISAAYVILSVILLTLVM